MYIYIYIYINTRDPDPEIIKTEATGDRVVHMCLFIV